MNKPRLIVMNAKQRLANLRSRESNTGVNKERKSNQQGNRTHIGVSISMTPWLREQAEKKAHRKRRTLSNYVVGLIEVDLGISSPEPDATSGTGKRSSGAQSAVNLENRIIDEHTKPQSDQQPPEGD